VLLQDILLPLGFAYLASAHLCGFLFSGLLPPPLLLSLSTTTAPPGGAALILPDIRETAARLDWRLLCGRCYWRATGRTRDDGGRRRPLRAWRQHC